MEIIKFEGSYCGICKAMEPTWKRVKDKNPDKKFSTISIEEHKEFVEKYEITAIPTFIVLNEDFVVGRIVGMANEKMLQSLVDKA